MLLWGWVLSGPPDAWVHHVGVGVRVTYSVEGVGATLTLAWDPAPIYYRPLPGGLCGEMELQNRLTQEYLEYLTEALL